MARALLIFSLLLMVLATLAVIAAIVGLIVLIHRLVRWSIRRNAMADAYQQALITQMSRPEPTWNHVPLTGAADWPPPTAGHRTRNEAD